MKFRQGKAPAILYRDGKKLWEFAAGILETDDPALIALLLERGAEGDSPSRPAADSPLPEGALDNAPHEAMAEKAPLAEGGTSAKRTGGSPSTRKRTKTAP